jgi:hypothetical protein
MFSGRGWVECGGRGELQFCFQVVAAKVGEL